VTSQLFAIIAPIFISAALGFGWARSKRAWDTEAITTLTYYIGTPMLVFSTLTSTPLTATAFFAMAGAALAALGGFVIFGVLALLVFRLPVRQHLAPLIFPNAGNMGLPLCLFAFGDPGLALGIAYFTVTSISNFTLGIWINSGAGSPLQVFRTPLIYAIAAALGLMISEQEVPLWLANTTELIGALTIPLILITLGVSLARLKVSNIRRASGLAIFRLLMGFGVGLAVAHLFGFEGVARGVVILQSAMPVAVFAFLFAQRYNNSPEDVAGAVVVSTALSFLSMPLLLLAIL
jgi:hypothetical protein